MDGLAIGIGVLFLLWGAGALIVTWLRPNYAERAVFRGVLLPGRIPNTRIARTLASLVPIALGGYFVASGISLSGSKGPSIAALLIFLASQLPLTCNGQTPNNAFKPKPLRPRIRASIRRRSSVQSAAVAAAIRRSGGILPFDVSAAA